MGCIGCGTGFCAHSKIKDSQCERPGSGQAFNFWFSPNVSPVSYRVSVKAKAIVVNGTTYDESKPTGTEIVASTLAGQCDSIIQVNLSYYPVARSNVRPVVCQGENVVIHGETFDLSRPTGTITLTNASIHGCDSILDVAIQLVQPSNLNWILLFVPVHRLPSWVLPLMKTTLPIPSFLRKANAAGCDSIVEVKVNFRNQVTATIQKKVLRRYQCNHRRNRIQ